MTKSELQREAQPLCDTSFTVVCNNTQLRLFNPFTPNRVKSKIDKVSQNYKLHKTEKNKQQHSKVLLNSFQTNAHN